MTCACARLDFADGSHGILIAAAEAVGRAMPLVERLQRLVEGIDSPIAAFARDGMFVGASDAARPLLGFRNLSEAGLDTARSDALSRGPRRDAGRHRPHGAAARRHRRGCRAGCADRAGAASR